MIIQKIKLENFKSHEYTVIDFNPGISIIMGENGAGKSSILEAISFALFKEHKTRIDQLVQNDKNRMRVFLEFSSNGKHYRISRKRQRGTKSTSKLEEIENGSYHQLASGEKLVNNYINEILEMDTDLFLNAVYVKQGEIADLINKKSAEKKEMIGRLLGIENLQKAWENMRRLINVYNQKKAQLKGKIESWEDNKQELEEKEKEHEKLIKDFDILKVNKENLEKKIENLEKQELELGQIKEQFRSLNHKIESKNEILNQFIENKERLKKELESIKAKEEDLKRIKPQISNLKPLKTLKKNMNMINILESKKDNLTESLNKLEELKTIMSHNEREYNQYKEITVKINVLNKKRKEYEGSKALEDQYQMNKKSLNNDLVKLERKIIKSLDRYGKKLGEEFRKVEELEEHVNVTKPLLEEEINKIREEIGNLDEDIIRLKSQIKNYQKPVQELETVENECPICQSPITPEKRDELLSNYQSEIEICIDNIDIFQKNKDKLENKRDVLDSKLNIINEIKVDLLNEQLENLEKGGKELDKIDSKIINIKSDVEKLERIDTKLDEYRAIQDELQENYNKYIGADNALESFENQDDILKKLEEIKEKIDPLKTENERIKDELGTVPDNLDGEIEFLEELKEEYNQLRGQISSKKEIYTQLEKIKEQLTSHNLELEKLESDLKALDYDADAHQNLLNTIEECEIQLSNLNNKLNRNIGKTEELSVNIKKLRDRLEMFKRDEKELEKTMNFIYLLNNIRDLFSKDGIQKDLRNISRPLIEKYTRSFFDKFNFEYSDIKLDENYDIMVYGPSGESQLDMVSGGERIAVALALRLGITQVLSKGVLEMIMLDEPTIHLDAYRRKELVELLKQMSIIPQMIIVTHDNDLEEAADNILKIEKENGISMLSSS
ncbi:MAG: SMC family ATPase [Methanobacteriaceae archaeon]|nr:SMC family ATPase [Methanobacteriaceae archaeon]